MRFREAHPDVIVGKRVFDSMQPYWVKKLHERNVCCCIYHVEMEELLSAFTQLRTKSGIHNKEYCNCQCEVCLSETNVGLCVAGVFVYPGLTTISEAVLCPRPPNSPWHSKDCFFGDCESCGVDILPMCPTEEDGLSPIYVAWKHYEMQSITTRKGLQRKKLQLVYKDTTSRELIQYLKPKLQFFVRHSFVAKWEDEQFRTCLRTSPADTMVSVIDYAENYSFEVQNEVQSMHWHSYQISILVHITYVRNPHPDTEDESTRNITSYHFYISDDMLHDSYFVQHCLLLHWESVVQGGFTPKHHWIWSDGCANQFKSRVPWYFVARYPEITRGCTCMWSFFGTGHGKGPHDGAGAVLKRYIRTAQLDINGLKLQCVAEVVSFLRKELSERPKTVYGDRRPVNRTFWHVLEGDVDREHEYDCEPIPRCRDLHSIRSVGTMEVGKLLKRHLACFCFSCIEGNWEERENRAWAGDWMLEVLVPLNAAYVWNVQMSEFLVDDWHDVGVNGAYFASILEVGDNFVVAASPYNEENVDFYVLVCTRKVYTCKSAFVCKWGEEFIPGDLVLEGLYYQKYGLGVDTYVLLRKSHRAHILADHVCAVKFPMLLCDHRVSGNDPVYKLQRKVEEAILEQA